MDFWRLPNEDFEAIAQRICRRNGWRLVRTYSTTTGLWRDFRYEESDGHWRFYRMGEAMAVTHIREMRAEEE